MLNLRNLTLYLRKPLDNCFPIKYDNNYNPRIKKIFNYEYLFYLTFYSTIKY